MIMTLIYRAIVLFVLLLVARCMFREKEFWKQATGASRADTPDSSGSYDQVGGGNLCLGTSIFGAPA